jgi:eukaryotic-like serine/threonine-protein kinase
LETEDNLIVIYTLAELKGDRSGMDRALTDAKGKPGIEDWISELEALNLASSGRLRDSREQTRHAIEVLERAGEKGNVAIHKAALAIREALFGNMPAAKQNASAALDLSKDRDTGFGAAFALALTGDSSRSQTVAEDLEKRFPEDTRVRFSYLPSIRALIALNGGDAQKAIDILRIAIPYDRAIAGTMFYGVFYPAYVRGLAYLLAHKGAEAAAEFQKILDSPGVVLGDPVGAFARFQIGKAYSLSGDKSKGKTAMQDFLKRWNGADPDSSILKQAKLELALME